MLQTPKGKYAFMQVTKFDEVLIGYQSSSHTHNLLQESDDEEYLDFSIISPDSQCPQYEECLDHVRRREGED